MTRLHTFIEDFFTNLTLKHALGGNAAVLAVSMTDIEHVLKVALLIVSIVLTCLTIWFKWQHNGRDK